jgi:hypothetical protein
MRVARYATAIALALLLAGCDLLFPVACTDVGCPDGLSVELSGTVAGEYTIEVKLPDGTVRSWSDTARDGVARAFFEVHAEELTVRVTTAEGSVEHTVRPQYEGLFPTAAAATEGLPATRDGWWCSRLPEG